MNRNIPILGMLMIAIVAIVAITATVIEHENATQDKILQVCIDKGGVPVQDVLGNMKDCKQMEEK